MSMFQAVVFECSDHEGDEVFQLVIFAPGDDRVEDAVKEASEAHRWGIVDGMWYCPEHLFPAMLEYRELGPR